MARGHFLAGGVVFLVLLEVLLQSLLGGIGESAEIVIDGRGNDAGFAGIAGGGVRSGGPESFVWRVRPADVTAAWGSDRRAKCNSQWSDK